MKVAIIGAGVAGLSCAYEFEKHGIIPTIFEKKRRIGEDVDFNTTTLKLFDRMYEDPLKYIKGKYNLELKPNNVLTKIIMHSPNEDTVINNTRGYIFLRGDNKNSLESQLASYVNSPITFNRYIYIDDIKNEYDYIIDATGTLDLAKQMGVYMPYFQAFIRISVIDGIFEINTIEMWVNTEYSRNGFCFLLPHSRNKACLVLTANNISHPELDYYWKKFISKENIKDIIIKTSDLLHETGAVFPHKVDNIYFVGKAAGFLDSIMGFGMISAIESGVLAARSIINNENYEELIKPIFKFMQKKYEFRKTLNTFKNEDFDRLVKVLGMPGIKQLIYNNPLAKVTQGAFLMKLYNMSRGN